jgi:hypothetical protein
MKKIFFIILSVLFVLSTGNAQNNTVNKIVNSNKKSNARLDKSLAIDVRNSNNNDALKAQITKHQQTDINYSTNIDAVFKKYDDRRSNNDVGLYLVKGNNLLVKTALLCFNDKMKIPILCDIAEKGLDKVESMVKETNDADARRLLKNGLDNVVNTAGSTVADNIKKNTDPQKFLNALEGHSKIMDGLYKNLTNATAEDRQVVLAAMLKTIDQEIKTGFKGVNAASKIQAGEIEQVNKNVTALSISFYKFADANNKRLDTIIQTQNEIKTQLEDINTRVGKTEKGVEFLQEYFFGRMSPGEQINALKLGMVPGISESKRNELIQKISLYEKQQKLNKTIRGYLEGAAEVVSIARKFGLDEKIAAKLNAGISIGTNAFKAFTAFQSGNFLGAISAVADIFGFGGPDVAAERHKEIMDALANIYQKLDIIEQKIDFLIKGQEQILKNQQQTFEALITISKQIDANQKEVREKLEAIHKDIIYDRQLLNNYVITKYTNCYRMIVNDPTSTKPDTLINTEINKFPAYDELTGLCNKWSSNGDINGCFDIISQVRKLNGTFDNPIFNLKSSEDPNNYKWVQLFIEKVHDPLISFIEQDTSISGLTINQKRTSLFVPIITAKGLDAKIQQIKALKLDLSTRYTTTSFPNSFKVNIATPLWFEAVERHINFILNIHYYRMVINRTTNQPYPKNNLVNSNVNTVGYEDLKNGLALLDYAIAQQNMYSGDILLPILGAILDNHDSLNLKKIEEANSLLNTNSLLANNFILYKFRKEVLATSNFINYEFGYKSHDNFTFSLNFKNNWNLEWNDNAKDTSGISIPKGWSTKIGNQYYSVPTPEDLQEGKLAYSQDIQSLINLKTRLLEEIDTYEIYNSLSQEERKSFNILNLFILPEQAK